MLFDFKNYQEKAVVELREKANKLLAKEGGRLLIFKSPTGSGKTLMMAEWMMRFCDAFSRTDGKKFSFIWIAVNKLHDQSHDSLKKFYANQGFGLRCSYFNELNDRRIRQNEILFLNWASINKGEKGIITRANERDNNISSVVARTKDDGKTLILVIDESHHTAKGDESKQLIKDIGSHLTIEVSATPQLTNLVDEIVTVELADVKDEGMIKKEIVINPGFESYKLDKKLADKGADKIVIETALKKRAGLAKLYEAEGSNVNPLMLIQIPDNRQGTIDKKDAVVRLLGKYGITTENGRLAIYLSDKDSKINLDNIEKNENEVEVMIFKQAIAVGWDCPRAAILVLFREWKSVVFSIQTIGRIMRMPEHEHYKNAELNLGYVYTSLSNIGIAEDIAKEYITVFEGKRRENYRDIDLTSYHSKRFREETRLSSDFVPIFFQAADELKLKDRISLKHSIVDTKLIASGKITDVDKETKGIEKKGTLDIPKNEVELQNAFDYFARENVLPDFAPELRSIKRINESIYKYFGASRDEDRWPEIQAVVLAEENRQAVIDVINRAKELYQNVVGKGKHELVENDEPWNVPGVINYNLNFVEKDYRRSVIQPYFAKTKSADNLSLFEEDSDIEVAFIEYLEKAKQVKWWFKNGRQDGSYFAVPYVENGQEKPFYLDFIVMLKDGRIGLFDTKGGIYAKTAKERAEGLAEYIAVENKKRKNLLGGIVIKEQNSWRYHDGKKYAYDSKNFKDWKFLDHALSF